MVKKSLSPTQSTRITELHRLISKQGTEDDNTKLKRESLVQEFDSIVAAECVLCGGSMVDAVDEEFDQKSVEADTWRI